MQIKGPLMDQKSGKKREKDWFQRSDLIPFASDLGEKKNVMIRFEKKKFQVIFLVLA